MNLENKRDVLTKLYESTYENFDLPALDYSLPSIIGEQLQLKLRRIYAKMQPQGTVTYLDGKPVTWDNGEPVLGDDIDWFMTIAAPEGLGKSTLASGIIFEWCKIAKMDMASMAATNIAFDEEDILRFYWGNFIGANKFVKENPDFFDSYGFGEYMKAREKIGVGQKYQFLWVDEGANVFFNRASMSKNRNIMMKFISSMRTLHCLTVICTVEYGRLDSIIKEQRNNSLLRIERKGVVHYYNIDQFRRLMAEWNRKRDMDISWRTADSEFAEHFGYNKQIKDIVDAVKFQSQIRGAVEALSWTKKLRDKKLKLINDMIDKEERDEDEGDDEPELDEKMG